MEFNKTVELHEGILKLFLSGYLNESTSFGTYDFASIKTVIFDLKHVVYINSMGIMSWIRWLEKAQNDNGLIDYYFINCPKIILDKANTINHFLPRKSTVQSFFAPYHCDPCSHSKDVELKIYENYDWDKATDSPTYDIPPVNCDKCGQSMTPDFMPEHTFQFMKRIQHN